MKMMRWTEEQLAKHKAKQTAADNQVRTIAADKGLVSKYRNVPVVIDGIRFMSKREGARWVVLKQQEEMGIISNLRRQVRYVLSVNGIKVCSYIADFVYDEEGKEIVEDCKGMRTDVYKIKARLMEACHGIIIRES